VPALTDFDYDDAGVFMDIRCVVTGQNESGKSVIVRDTPVKPVTLSLLPGYEYHRVWGSDRRPELPSDGTPTPQPDYFPPTGGFRCLIFTIPPGKTSRANRTGTRAALDQEIREKLPGLFESLEPDHPSMHTTDTVDFCVVLSGEVYLELDDRAEVLLKAGDCVIQNGTRHAWHNRSSEKCVVSVVLIGAERKPQAMQVNPEDTCGLR
jgi:mannose-6-phosphate isomerase-like protein (cupin superfamily)